jgi:formate dehydrogenase major subunit
VPVTAELQPEGFAEISPELADLLGIRNLDWVTVATPRGEIEVKALVTERVRPFRLDGHTVHEVGLVWHFGWMGYARGEVANVLTSVVGDPNTSIHEGKALVCNVRRGRREEGRGDGP